MRRHIRNTDLVALLDGELAPPGAERVQHHLAGCEPCSQRLERLRGEMAAVDAELDKLAPAAHQAPDAARALREFRAHRELEDNPYGRISLMDKLRMNKNVQRAVSGAAVVMVLAVLFALEPVRAAAHELLSIFRVENFVVLPVSTGQMENLANVERTLGRDYFPGTYDMITEPGEAQHPESLAAASEAAGFAVRTPATQGPADEYIVRGEMAMRLIPDREMMQEIFTVAGLSPDLVPEGIDGQPFELTVPRSVVQVWGTEEEALVVMQMPSPSVEFPAGVDEDELAVAMLQLLGYSAEDAQKLSASINWTTTIVLPLPQEQVSFEEVPVDGASGFVLVGEAPAEATDAPNTAVLWQKDGMIYLVSGIQDSAALLEIANSLQ